MKSKSSVVRDADDDLAPAIRETVVEVVPAAPPAAASDVGTRTAAVNRDKWLRGKGGRYLVRLCALVAAVAIWHFASTHKFNFYINFEHVPAPLVVGQGE